MGRRPTLDWSCPDEERFAEGFRTLSARLADGQPAKGVPVTVMTAPRSSPRTRGRSSRTPSAASPSLPAGLYAYGFFRPARRPAAPRSS